MAKRTALPPGTTPDTPSPSTRPRTSGPSSIYVGVTVFVKLAPRIRRRRLLQLRAQPAHTHNPKESVSITRTYNITKHPSGSSPQGRTFKRSRLVVEVWKRERGDEREPGKADGQTRVGPRRLCFRLLLHGGLGRYALLLWGRDIRIDLYIPDRLQPVHAADTDEHRVANNASRRKEHSLVALEVPRDLVLHAQRNAIELPCHLCRVAALV